MSTLHAIRKENGQAMKKYKPASGSFIKIQPSKTKEGHFNIVDVVSTGDNKPHIAEILKFMSKTPDEYQVDDWTVKFLMHEGLFEQIVVQDKPFRTPEQIAKHSAEVKVVARQLLEKYGLAFKGERSGDLTVREGAENFIAKEFVFDGSGSKDGEIMFRRIVNGALGKPFTADELVNYYFNPNSSPIIDKERTRQNRDKAFSDFKEMKLRGKKRNEMTMEEIREFDQIVSSDFEQAVSLSRKMYTNKTLPKFNESELRQRLDDEATSTYGLPKRIPGQQFQYDKADHYKIDRYVEDNFNRMTSLHSYEELKPLFTLEPKQESWEGITNEQ